MLEREAMDENTDMEISNLLHNDVIVFSRGMTTLERYADQTST